MSPLDKLQFIGIHTQRLFEALMPVPEDILIHDYLYESVAGGDAVGHGEDQRKDQHLEEEPGVTEQNKQGEDGEEGIAHAWVLEQVDISPKASDEEGDVADHP